MKLRIAQVVRVAIDGMPKPFWPKNQIGSLLIVDADEVKDIQFKEKSNDQPLDRKHECTRGYLDALDRWIWVPNECFKTMPPLRFPLVFTSDGAVAAGVVDARASVQEEGGNAA